MWSEVQGGDLLSGLSSSRGVGWERGMGPGLGLGLLRGLVEGIGLGAQASYEGVGLGRRPQPFGRRP